MQISTRNQLACVFNQKDHKICRETSYFECTCLDLNKQQNEIANTYVCCFKCLSDQYDYSGNFKCPKCNKELNKKTLCNDSTLTELREIYGKQIRLNLKEITCDLLFNSLNAKQSLKGNQLFM